MRVIFTNCWVGCYQGEGCYEGGTCPDCLVTNVPEDIDTDELFDIYLTCLCCGFGDHDKKDYTTKIVKRLSKKITPVKVTSLDMLENNNEEFIEVDFNDLVEWMEEYVC